MSSAASRLCQSCGMCCNGTMFMTVRLQASDSAQELKALGFRVQHKKKHDFFDQPCFAHQGNTCSIYADRPSRCRLFECQQIKRLAQREITEEKATSTIQEALCKVDRLKKQLFLLGSPNPKKPLLQQYQQIIADPLYAGATSAEVADRVELDTAFKELDCFLDKEFRSEGHD